MDGPVPEVRHYGNLTGRCRGRPCPWQRRPCRETRCGGSEGPANDASLEGGAVGAPAAQERPQIVGARFGDVRQAECPVERVEASHVALGPGNPCLGVVPLLPGRQGLRVEAEGADVLGQARCVPPCIFLRSRRWTRYASSYPVIRRHRYTGELSFYRCHSTTPVTPATLIDVITRRSKVEEDFQLAKGACGLDGRGPDHLLELLDALDPDQHARRRRLRRHPRPHHHSHRLSPSHRGQRPRTDPPAAGHRAAPAPP